MILNSIINVIEVTLSIMGLTIIFLNSIRFFIKYIYYLLGHQDFDYIRLSLGNNIIFGLDFIVAADIAHSMIELQYYAIGRLAIMVILRILLSYFLIKELDHIPKK